MALTGIDRRQVVQLAGRGWNAERIAVDLGIDLELVREAMPGTIMDKLEASPDGWLYLGYGPIFAKLASDPEKDGFYIVGVTDANGQPCSCKGMRYRGHCTHGAQAVEHVRQLSPTQGLTAE